MERRITNHSIDRNEPLIIRAHGEGPNHYLITADPRTVPLGTSAVLCDVRFQHGQSPAQGVNGVTIEALLAICADRLAVFQDGPLACVENAHALAFVSGAIEELHNRTRSLAAMSMMSSAEG